MKKIIKFFGVVGFMGICFSLLTGLNFSALKPTQKSEAASASQIYVSAGSTFIMEGGVIQNATGVKGGAVYVGKGATFTMNNGRIANCQANQGGAVYVDEGATFNFYGGEISDCADSKGYAVYLAPNAKLAVGTGIASASGVIYQEYTYSSEGASVKQVNLLDVYVNGTLNKTMVIEEDSYTLNQAEMPLDYKNCCGYFTNSALTNVPENDTISFASSKRVSVYTKRATSFLKYLNLETDGEVCFASDLTTLLGGELVIPRENDNGVAITKTTASAFVDQTGITSVVLPRTFTEFGEKTFYGCSNLAGVNLLNSITALPNYLFYGCSKLQFLNLPSSLQTIGNYVFQDTGLVQLTIPSKVTSIGTGVFNGCRNLFTLSVNNQNSVYASSYNAIIVRSTGELLYGGGNCELRQLVGITSIGANAFRGRGMNYNIIIPTSVTSIGSMAFREVIFREGLTALVRVPASVQTLGATCFMGSKVALVEFVAGSALEIPMYCFQECTALTTITLPDNTSGIRNYAFKDCTKLKYVIIPPTATGIAIGAFYGCTSMQGIYIPSSVTIIAATSVTSSPFYGCNVLVVFYEGSTIPTTWGTYWNYKSATSTIKPRMKATLDSFKYAMGITSSFVDDSQGSMTECYEIESYKIEIKNENTQDVALLDKKEKAIIKDEKKVA